jgi:hypothetical protein
MDNLKLKIEKTDLFTDEAKVKLLAHFDELPEDEKEKLGETIDEFDRATKAAGVKLKNTVRAELDSLKAEATDDEKQNVDDATRIVELGLDILAPAQ